MEKQLEAVAPLPKGAGFLNQAAELPGVFILAVGPHTCLRNLFFSFYQAGLEHKLFSLPVDACTFAAGTQTALVEQALRHLIDRENPQAVLIYPSCSDLLASAGYQAMGRNIEQETGVLTMVLERGSLSIGKMTPKDKFRRIMARLAANGLMPEGGNA